MFSLRPGSPDYNLHISHLVLSDGGLYLCQLNTPGGLVRRVRLTVRGREGSVRALQDRREGRENTRILGPSTLTVEVRNILSEKMFLKRKYFRPEQV